MFVRDVTRALDEAGVPYCIVGGLAVNLHGIPRTTLDVDLVVPREADMVALKRAAGRAQDLADLRHLERLLPRERP